MDLAVQYVDHNVIQLDFKNPDDHRFAGLRRRIRLHYSRPGERHLPLPARGALRQARRDARGGGFAYDFLRRSGSIAIGAGGLDVALVMAGQPFQTPAPKVVGVELTGTSLTG